MSITLLIQRASGAYDRYEVSYQEGMSVLDAVKSIGQRVPDLAYRWECGQGICGVCTIRINGAPALSCTTLARPDTSYTLEPIPGFPVEKDLLVDYTPRLEKLLDVKPYLIEGGQPIATKAEADASKLLRSCIECMACVAVCPVSLKTANADALAMVKLARFALDPRDGEDRREMAEEAGLDVYTKTCPSCRACATICPRQIDVYEHAVKVLAETQTSEQAL
ncbi:MAG TPA: 2Fe-2S iron-sulfur cluster-binding protein [Aggregatilineales bacterium]|nr:2Fe-2S iron-sulfur cluster-binding protein [Aggregatilineales bacterium]